MAAIVESEGTNTTTGGSDNPMNTNTIGVYVARLDLRNFGIGDNVRVWAASNVDEGSGVITAVLSSVDVVGPIDDGSAGAPQMVEIGPLVSTATSGDGSISVFIKRTSGSDQPYFWQLIKVV